MAGEREQGLAALYVTAYRGPTVGSPYDTFPRISVLLSSRRVFDLRSP